MTSDAREGCWHSGWAQRSGFPRVQVQQQWGGGWKWPGQALEEDGELLTMDSGCKGQNRPDTPDTL